MTTTPKKRESRKVYLRTEKGKEKLRRKYKKRIEQNRAKEAVKWQIKKGNMKPAKEMICKDCGSLASHYHHESYKPEDRLKVIPLCRPCHHARHGQPPPRPTE